MAKKGVPVRRKKSKRNEILLRLVWGFIGFCILLVISNLCLITESCNSFIVIAWCVLLVVGISFLIVAGYEMVFLLLLVMKWEKHLHKAIDDIEKKAVRIGYITQKDLNKIKKEMGH